ncbi:hypothetical protein HNY73_000465 [Argiope bruennichi]|uniref:Uncharacterized protein n=1 Tax=Argiope bruennichi TaxID=94029 RepID=A0A8T0G0S2_ARGBR|nr:hypothetical protein HNY73_000465 [Argiope bruennichi]
MNSRKKFLENETKKSWKKKGIGIGGISNFIQGKTIGGWRFFAWSTGVWKDAAAARKKMMPPHHRRRRSRDEAALLRSIADGKRHKIAYYR